MADKAADSESAVETPGTTPAASVASPEAQPVAGGGTGGIGLSLAGGVRVAPRVGLPPSSGRGGRQSAAARAQLLQRAVGNAATTRMLQRRPVPAKTHQLMIPPIGTAQDMAEWFSKHVDGLRHRDNVVLVDSERKELWVFKDAAAPRAVKRLRLAVYRGGVILLPEGIWRWNHETAYGLANQLFDDGWVIWENPINPNDLVWKPEDTAEFAPDAGDKLFAIHPPQGTVLDPSEIMEVVVRGTRLPKDWASRETARAKAKIKADAKKPPKEGKGPPPTELVPWPGKNGKWYLNVWLGGEHKTLELTSDEPTDKLVDRILEKTAELKAEDDPARSTRVAGTKPGPPQFVGGTQGERRSHVPGRAMPEPGTAGKSPYNAPAFPAKIISHGPEGSAGHEGAEITVTGASVDFTMRLDYQAVTADFLQAFLAAWTTIEYTWDIFDVSKVTLGQLKTLLGKPTSELKSEIDALKTTLETETDEAKRQEAQAQLSKLEQDLAGRGQDPDSGQIADMTRSWANTWEDTKEDLTSVPMFIPGANVAWVTAIAVSDVVELVGAPIKSLFGALAGPINDKDIEFPSEGTFLIRCIADPVITEDQVERIKAKGMEPIFRPPSVAYIAVRVVPIHTRAAEVNDAELTAIESLKKLIDVTPGETARASYQAQLSEAQEALGDNNIQAIERAKRNARKEIDRVDKWQTLVAADVTDDQIADQDPDLLSWKAMLDLRGISLSEWKKAQQEAIGELDKALARVGTWGLDARLEGRQIFRPRITLVSEADGHVYPIVANLVEEKGSQPGDRRWRLIDVSSDETKKIHEGSGATHNAAINAAFEHFKWHAGYGRGTIAIRLPENLKEIDGEKIDVPTEMRAQLGMGERWEQRLAELATAAEVASMFVTGPLGAAIGIAGGLISAGLAIKNFVTRIQAGKPVLSWETAMDAFAVVGALTMMGSAAMKSARFAELAARAKPIGNAIHVATTVGQVIVIPISTYSELAQITAEEDEEIKAKGGDRTKVDHGKYEARRLMAFARAVKSGVVMARMAQMASDPELGWDPLKKKTASAGKPPEPPPGKPPVDVKPGGTGATTTEHPTAGGGEHLPPAVKEKLLPHDPFHVAEQQGAVAPGSAEAVVRAAGDWKLRLRTMVDKFAPEVKAEAAHALAEVRRTALDHEYGQAEGLHGCVAFDVGTVGFDSDIDATMIPKEALADYTGPRRPVSDQIKAAAEAAQQVVTRLRQRFGGDPDTVLDVAIHAYLGEDIKPQYKTPADEAAARAHDTAVSFAEMRRGMTRDEWLALEQDYVERLGSKDAHPLEKKMLQQIQDQMIEGFQFKKRMDDLMSDTMATVAAESKTPLTGEQATALARDRILLTKRRALAEAFKGYPDVDWVAIKKLQSEIRWFAPGAYATEAAFTYAVRYGQVRKEAGKAAAKAAGGGPPTTQQVLSDLNPNLDEERWVSPAERSARLANAANANIGELGRHPHGADPKAAAKDAAKYAGRVLDAWEGMGGPVRHGAMEDALRLFKQSKWPDGTPQLRDLAVARWADEALDGRGVTHNLDGTVTISADTYTAFATAAEAWMRRAAIEARITERAMADRTEVPERPTPKPAGPPPSTPAVDAIGLSEGAKTAVLAAMPPETAVAVAGWLGRDRLESISASPDRLRQLLDAHQRVLPALTDPLSVAGLRRLTETQPRLPGAQKPAGDTKVLNAILSANPDTLALALRVFGRPDMQSPGLHPQRGSALADMSNDIVRMTTIDRFGAAAYDELWRNAGVGRALDEKVGGLADPAARVAAIEQILNAESTAQRRSILKLPGPQRRSKSLDVKPDKSDPAAWQEYVDDATAFIKDPAHAKAKYPGGAKSYADMTPAELDRFVEARATLLQIKDRFADAGTYRSWQNKLTQKQKLRILDQMDALAETHGVIPQWNPRARVAEALYLPGGGFNQKSFPNPVFPSAGGGSGFSRLDGVFAAGERTGSGTQREWIEFKSHKEENLTAALAGAHVREGWQDWHALLWDQAKRDDGLVIWYAREPTPAVKQQMTDILLGSRSPFRAVRFGDGPWVERAPTTAMPAAEKLPPWWTGPPPGGPDKP